jgi:citrate lyase subunit beta/citryl-CoA lyase
VRGKGETVIRSVLFVPSDSEKKLARAGSSGADVLVLDLEDSVLPDRKPLARDMTRGYLHEAATRANLWIRVNDLASGELLKDLAKIVPAGPAGIILPKIRGPEDVRTVGCYLDALEVAHEVAPGSIRMLVLVTETPAAILRLGELVREGADPRIAGLMWGAEDLSSALGAGDPRTAEGGWRSTYEYARIQCLLASHALGVEAIDTVYVNYRDPEGLRKSCQVSRYDGFTGRVAIHPEQVPIINEAFTPTGEEVALARRIVDAFTGGAGAVALDGKMYDIPHLKAARRLLASVRPG